MGGRVNDLVHTPRNRQFEQILACSHCHLDIPEKDFAHTQFWNNFLFFTLKPHFSGHFLPLYKINRTFGVGLKCLAAHGSKNTSRRSHWTGSPSVPLCSPEKAGEAMRRRMNAQRIAIFVSFTSGGDWLSSFQPPSLYKKHVDRL